MWSLAKIRIACLVLLCAAMPAVAGFTVPVPFVKWLCLAWLVGVALLIHCLSRRASLIRWYSRLISAELSIVD
jgi:hypothetical protein